MFPRLGRTKEVPTCMNRMCLAIGLSPCLPHNVFRWWKAPRLGRAGRRVLYCLGAHMRFLWEIAVWAIIPRGTFL